MFKVKMIEIYKISFCGVKDIWLFSQLVNFPPKFTLGVSHAYNLT